MSDSIALVRYDAACRALAEAKSTDEVKSIRNQAEAMRAYARQAKNKQLEVDAAEIRIRAERRLGELIAAQKETVGLNPGAAIKHKEVHALRFGKGVVTPTLKEAGIDWKLSSRAQKLAAVSESDFEEALDGWRDRVEQESARVTVDLLKAGAKKLAKKAREEDAESLTVAGESLELLIESGRRFATIYADPPWKYGNQRTRSATDNYYSTMTPEEIAALPILELAEDNAHLHLWTTNAFLFESKAIMEAWGFEYKSIFVWCKEQIGIGNYWRVSHEFLLFGIRGNLPFQDRSLRSWKAMPRTRHSVKPEEVRLMVERASPSPRLELFGRRVAAGWTVWGNEVERGLFDGEVAEL